MNITDAKSIPLDEFLENLGHTCTKEAGGRKWYRSPYRDEKTPSFVLSRDKHAWYDHGEGAGGNILDLAIKYANLDGISEALKFIEKTVGTGYTIPTIRQELKPVQPDLPYYTLIDQSEFQIYSGRALSKNAQYLVSRGIDPKAAAPYLKAVRFTQRDGGKKVYSGFGLPNIAGGFEVRRAGDWAKTSVGHKDVSAFSADRENAPWHCFYSMIDFCTFLTIDKPPVGAYNYLIVNGDGLIEKAEQFLEPLDPGFMIHYPHSDPSGQKAYARLLQFTVDNGWSGGDRAHIYEGFKDWTEAREKALGLDRKNVSLLSHNQQYNSKPKI